MGDLAEWRRLKAALLYVEKSWHSLVKVGPLYVVALFFTVLNGSLLSIFPILNLRHILLF